VAGLATLPGDVYYHAFLWTWGVLTDLGTLPGGHNSVATFINDRSIVVGQSDSGTSAGNPLACLWDDRGQIHDLGTLPGGSNSTAFGINIFDYVVGSSNSQASGAGPRAFVWTRRHGMQDLNALIPAGSGWTLLVAKGINVRGQIVGLGTVAASGQTHAFLLTPQ
jgi:probable HAF family extracellular repeat protein